MHGRFLLEIVFGLNVIHVNDIMTPKKTFKFLGIQPMYTVDVYIFQNHQNSFPVLIKRNNWRLNHAFLPQVTFFRFILQRMRSTSNLHE